MIGRDHAAEEIRTFRVSRIRGEIRFATRRERDFRLPPEFNAQAHRPPPAWQMGEIVGEARIELSGDTAWWVERTHRRSGRLEDGVFVTPYASLEHLASWVLRLDGRAVPLEPDELRREVAASLRRCASATRASRPRSAARRAATMDEPWPSVPPARSRPSASGCSRRCSRTSSRRAARSTRR